MNLRTPLAAVLIMALSGALVFVFSYRRLASPAFAAYPEVTASLKQYREDLRRLRELDPDARATYRQHFDAAQQLLERIEILQLSRERMERLYELVLLAGFAGTVLFVAAAYTLHQRRLEARLGRLQEALTALANGRTDLEVGEGGRDVIGRIAAMIERTSRVMARDRRRLAALRNLSSWQEAARRHAHEMRTPLTAARLELTRLEQLLAGSGAAEGEAAKEAAAIAASALQEIDRLALFTRHFTSFARLPRPQLARENLGRLARELVATFAGAWPNLELSLEAPESATFPVDVDRDMLRQVLVNLCDNSSQALGEGSGRVCLALASDAHRVVLEVRDDGPGIDPEIRDRLFEPYTTTRGIGEGMGLGLAISKKIQLDHGGDLELIDTPPPGACFRLTFPAPPASLPSKEISCRVS